MISRRHFLGVVGVVGAASALSFVPGLKRARAQGMLGQVYTFARGGVTIHSYVAPDASFSVTSHIIETPNNLVVVDTQLAQTFANEVRAYADSLGKPVDRVILSHGHPDHFLGGNVWEDVPFVTTEAIAGEVQAYIDADGVQGLIPILGESEVPTEVRPVEGGLEAGDLTIDGVDFTLEVVNNAEALEHLNVRVPAANVLIVQDLIYNNNHFFPGVDRANWISILEGLRDTLTPADILLVGHGVPTTKGELDVAIQYLTTANEAVAAASSADEVIAALQEAYPTYDGAGLLSFWQQFFQPS